MKLFTRLFLVGNLLLALTGAIRAFPSGQLQPGFLRHLFDVYGYLTSTARHHGFFAPGVVSSLQVDYVLYHAGAKVKAGHLTTDNLEVRHRLGNLFNKLWLKKEDVDLRRAIAASLAAKLFTAHSGADRVEIIVKAFVLPSLHTFKEGDRPFWETSYQGYFTKSEI